MVRAPGNAADGWEQGAQADQPHRAEIDPATVFGDVPVETVKPGLTAATLPDSFALPPGTFFAAASLHGLASGARTHLRTLTGEDAQVDACRFRPNMVVEAAPGVEGFVEDDWLEGTLEVGERVCIVQLRPTLRCVMTTHRQAELGRDLHILRTAAQHHQAEIGVWAAIGTPGTVRVSDEVAEGHRDMLAARFLTYPGPARRRRPATMASVFWDRPGHWS